ncbi:PLP-dependent aminotransferase family protein [Rhodococcus fascians]|uniref:aminotransferase-like domain-containing protein n=1 Tax=Rhodococcoides fascians TaxID=1828 RepID=UPI0024B6AFC0|nr:PLP-dependent aminotransferase family protein [Rhodococcus fascians]MDJ0004847.1 PLP-dependent aminotransferase family protein [Rhodococcus fascians]
MTEAGPRQDSLVQGEADKYTFDLGPGYLGEALLPTRSVADAYAAVMSEFPLAALSYGPEQGPKPAREAIAVLRGTDPDAILMTSGISAALDAFAALYRPYGSIVLTGSVSYDLADAVFRDHGYQVTRAVSGYTDPIWALEEALRRHPADIAFIYLTPTLANPTGHTMTAEQRNELLALAVRFDVPIIEDDAYADHVDPNNRQMSLTSLGLALYTSDGRPLVVGLGSASKVLGAGLRVGWLQAPPIWLRTYKSRGIFQSGGCANQISSLALAHLLDSGDFVRQADHLRLTLAERAQAFRDAVTSASERLITAPTLWRGGLFDWLEVPDSVGLAAAAESSGIRVYPGRRFGEGENRHLRVSFGVVTAEEATKAGQRLGQLAVRGHSARGNRLPQER